MSDTDEAPAGAPQTPPPESGDEPRPAPTRTQPDGEIAGPKGPEPTRYGDWEKNGRCSDF